MGLYKVPVFMYLLGFDMSIMFTNFHMCGMMLMFNASLYILVRYVSPRGPMCFMCLMFNLSESMECFAVFLYRYVYGPICVVVLFVLKLLIEYAICFLLLQFVLNMIMLLFVTVFLLLEDHVLSCRVCACCDCDPNASLGVPSIFWFVCAYVGGDISFSAVSEGS